MPGPWRTTTHLPYPFTMEEFEACPPVDQAGRPPVDLREEQAEYELRERAR